MFEKSKRVLRQTALLAVPLVNPQDSIIADETLPPVGPALLHHGLDLSQQLPHSPETRLCPTLDRHQIFLSDRTLCDRKERATTVNSEVVVGCLGEVQLWIRVTPVEVCGGDL